MVTLLRFSHPAKAVVPMEISSLESTASTRDAHPLNALFSTTVTVSGIVIFLSLLQNVNAPFPIALTGMPSKSGGILISTAELSFTPWITRFLPS